MFRHWRRLVTLEHHFFRGHSWIRCRQFSQKFAFSLTTFWKGLQFIFFFPFHFFQRVFPILISCVFNLSLFNFSGKISIVSVAMTIRSFPQERFCIVQNFRFPRFLSKIVYHRVLRVNWYLFRPWLEACWGDDMKDYRRGGMISGIGKQSGGGKRSVFSHHSWRSDGL